MKELKTIKQDIMKNDYWNQELVKCKKSPYYFATKYLTVNGRKFTTLINEQEFNKLFKHNKNGK